VEKTLAAQAWKTALRFPLFHSPRRRFFGNHFTEMLEPPKMAQLVETSFFRT
jgi:hypothetical protein